MKKSLNQTLEGDATERNALTRKLYRYISEAARRVDEGTARSKSIVDLFTSTLEVHRQKLRENCEKLIFADPLLYGRKAQELLWRKGYYEVVSTAKRIRAANKGQEELVLAHIESGIGHYHHLIFKAQTEINVDLNNLIDYPQLDIEVKCSTNRYSDKMEELKDWAKSFIQTCLIYLGDLSRYKTEYEEFWDPSMAYRYYIQAASVDSDVGMPYNQLGTLYTGRNYHLDSVHYYIVCLSCSAPFDGGEGNLVRIFDKNSKQLEGNLPKNTDIIDQQESVKFFICKFLTLVDGWFFEKELPDFNELCNGTLYDLKECLQFRPMITPDQTTCHEEYLKYVLQNEVTPEYLNPKLINKFVIIILLCMNKLQKESSSHLFPLKAFTLAVLAQLLQKLQSDLVNVGFEIVNPVMIIHGYKDRIRNQKNIAANKNPIENGFHESHKTKMLPSLKENIDNSLNSPMESKITNMIENVSHLEIMDGEGDTVEPIPDKPQPSLNNIDKSSRNKHKKPSILQKLRRRRRRMDSFDGSDKTASEDFTDESDLEDNKISGDSSSSSEDDNMSVNSYSSASSSNEEEDEGEGAHNMKNTDVKEADSVESSHNNKDYKVNNVPDNETEERTSDSPSPKTQDETENTVKEFDEKLLKEFLENDNILMALHLLLNWLYGEVDLIVSCGSGGRAMFQTLVDILNTIHRQIFPKLMRNTYSIQNQYHPSLKPFHEIFFASKYTYRKMPLVEDYEVKSLEILQKGLSGLDWGNQNANISTREANAVRLLKFLDFGIFIVKLNVGIIYNKRLKLYILKKPSSKKTASNFKKFGKTARDIHHSKNPRVFKPKSDPEEASGKQSASGGSLMKSLGRLWLSEQVRALESEVGAKRRPQLPAYLVVDAEALCQQTHLVKQLVASRKVIVLIPTIVLQTIDDLKKESGAARSAIRWLELQLRNGSRFVRTQRLSETAPLPCVKYPKKMHRDVQNFVQIIEFCHFFISKESSESTMNIQKFNGSGDRKDNANDKHEIKTDMIGSVLSKNNENNANTLVVLLTGANHLTFTEQKDFSYTGLAHSAGVTIENIQEFCSKWKHCFSKGGKKR